MTKQGKAELHILDTLQKVKLRYGPTGGANTTVRM